MSMFKVLVVSLFITGASISFAGPQCMEEKTNDWLSEQAMKDKISKMGLSYEVFKVTRGNCYEIYGHNEQGEKVEIYFHPVTGDIIKQKTKS